MKSLTKTIQLNPLDLLRMHVVSISFVLRPCAVLPFSDSQLAHFPTMKMMCLLSVFFFNFQNAFISSVSSVKFATVHEFLVLVAYMHKCL